MKETFDWAGILGKLSYRQSLGQVYIFSCYSHFHLSYGHFFE